MPVMTETTSTNGKGALNARRQKPAAPSAVQRRRQVPWIVAGVLLVVGCALAFGVASFSRRRTARMCSPSPGRFPQGAWCNQATFGS
jgi:hypothetical protein